MPNNENISDIENRCTLLNHVASRNAGSGYPGHFCSCNPASGKILLVESETLEFGIWNPTNDWNPESKFHQQRLEFSTWNPESTA